MSDGLGIVALRAPSEATEVLALWLASWRATYADIDFEARSPWFLERLAELEAEGAQTLCLHDAARKRLAGFVIIHPETGWLDQLCVHPDFFGVGVAAALLAAARRVAPAGVRLDVNADNLRARRFYEREGFSCRGPGAPSRSGRATLVLEWLPGPAETAGRSEPASTAGGRRLIIL